MKGIILAGGDGTRLRPLTTVVSKQLLPVYDKPMIYYPLATLMLAGITEIQVISSPRDLPALQELLGDGSLLGISLSYAEQSEPRGIADAFLISAGYIGDDSAALILGDNIFHGHAFGRMLQNIIQGGISGCVLFGYPVQDFSRYGIISLDNDGNVISIQEKPVVSQSNIAVTGLYLYDNKVTDIAKGLLPSRRGELEITDVNQAYLERGEVTLVPLGRWFTWMDAGTPDALIEASRNIQDLKHSQDIRIACLEEIAWRKGYISREACHHLGTLNAESPYGQYIMQITETGELMSDPVTPEEHEQAKLTAALATDHEALVSTACPECQIRFALLVHPVFVAKERGTYSLSGSQDKIAGWTVNKLRCVKCGWTGDGELKNGS